MQMGRSLNPCRKSKENGVAKEIIKEEASKNQDT